MQMFLSFKFDFTRRKEHAHVKLCCFRSLFCRNTYIPCCNSYRIKGVSKIRLCQLLNWSCGLWQLDTLFCFLRNNGRGTLPVRIHWGGQRKCLQSCSVATSKCCFLLSFLLCGCHQGFSPICCEQSCVLTVCQMDKDRDDVIPEMACLEMQ